MDYYKTATQEQLEELKRGLKTLMPNAQDSEQWEMFNTLLDAFDYKKVSEQNFNKILTY